MKNLLLFALLLLVRVGASAQQWQQRVDHRIDVQLDARARTLDGFERITYYNRSPDTLRFIWFHVWPNAYKNDRTAYVDQQLRNGDTRAYFADESERGYINRLDFRVNGQVARTEDHPQHIDIIRLLLPAPLAPGDSAGITTPFHVKLPRNFSRGGYEGRSIQATQWYPKPAVYDAQGWHPMPYLDQGEFYNEFGNYEVSITLPSDYVIAATGTLVEGNDTNGAVMLVQPVKNSVRGKVNAKPGTKPVEPAPAAPKTVRFAQQDVHDFAWFADPDLIKKQDTCLLPSGRSVLVKSYYTKVHDQQWDSSLVFAKRALRFYSAEAGEYPYPVVSIVQGPAGGAGSGMEYPSITLIGPASDSKRLDEVITHEIGHNWFQGLLANNERTDPWLDEGINTYFERKYMTRVYGPQPQAEERLLKTLEYQLRDQPIATTSDSFHQYNYAMVVYYKTARWMEGIERELGTDSMRQMMQAWFSGHAGSHVTHGAFHDHLASWMGTARADRHWSYLHRTGPLPANERGSNGWVTPFTPRSIRAYINEPYRKPWLLAPTIGANGYDKLMVGAVLTNYGLPPSALQVLAVPLYATGSKQWNGLGRLSYSKYFTGRVHKAEVFVNGSTFSRDEFTDEKKRTLYSRFFKVVPGAEVTLRNRDPRSTRYRSIQWKTFFLGEDVFRSSFDTIITGTDTAILLAGGKADLRYAVHQLRFSIADDRALYPYAAAFWVQQSAYFTRLNLEGSYFFNYAREGGLSVRLFAGKFFYDRNRSDYPTGFYPGRYMLTLSGAGGDEDFTYSHYFAARNEFEGFRSQQIAIRDGGFKIRTPLLSEPVGRSDDWLAALNFNTSIPARINPLSVLPVKVPLHLFFDIGTYSGAWKPGASTDRFLFDAGLHLPLLSGVVNFYFPVVYSKIYREYTRSIYPDNRFFRTMTFSIDLEKASRFLKHQMLL
ncbi:M1 family peptidase [Flaviaesturariibacter flavus]|uniref:M1 family peptidase n=1 Tax=Flaviaesturariibacter flavus TaxID=2502780 RepID=A0A4V2NWH5_9BACT|nr:M1 family metallopeptidase [Flaviaesturariibacter flavus]TCJ17412.1 M1 family peptidase [Flaviaesturariibacter flavus]